MTIDSSLWIIVFESIFFQHMQAKDTSLGVYNFRNIIIISSLFLNNFASRNKHKAVHVLWFLKWKNLLFRPKKLLFKANFDWFDEDM